MERKFKENSFHDNGFYSCFALKKLGKKRLPSVISSSTVTITYSKLSSYPRFDFKEQFNIRNHG